MVWAGWLYSQEWWRKELWRTASAPGTTFDQYMFSFRKRFSADANNYILQARSWEAHNVGNTPGFNGDAEKALASIKVPVLYMPSATDLYFPVGDAQYEAKFIPKVELLPIPSLWGHPAGAGASPADKKFLNENIARFLGNYTPWTAGLMPRGFHCGLAVGCSPRPIPNANERFQPLIEFEAQC